MNSREAIKLSINTGDMISMAYLQDLSDEQLMQRPHPECNHIKWQIGHLVTSERMMIESVVPGSMPSLPEGFSERYGKERASSDDPTAFDSKEELLRVYQEQRGGTLAALEKLTDEELDKPSPESMQAYAPTVAAAFSMQGSHWIMHAGQWAVLRRQLGKPPLF
ncbi:MAG: DinB family protein [Planctomycetaceae bacterium]|nr:DinB family protein [Planctomycetales bacterium]MCB9922692.1 DinB family protein [Planctomycetaceae bacterium]